MGGAAGRHWTSSPLRMWVPSEVEEDAVSELEVREWLEEQGAGAEEPGAGGEQLLFLPTPDFMASAGEG